jgi:hypothetical protein
VTPPGGSRQYRFGWYLPGNGSTGNHHQGSQSDGMGMSHGDVAVPAERGRLARLDGRPKLLGSQKIILDIGSPGDLGGTQEAQGAVPWTWVRTVEERL